MKIFPILIALAAHANAASASPGKLVAEIEGVYKEPVLVTTPYGQIKTENIVEVVRHDDSHVYVRARLVFPTGDMCAIAGIAGGENGHFVHHDPEKPLDGEAPCRLRVGLDQDTLTMTDRLASGAASCRAHCGVSASLSDFSIPKNSKRKIRYLDRLKASRHYLQAIENFRKYQSSLPGAAK